jgi:hypothetical protein
MERARENKKGKVVFSALAPNAVSFSIRSPGVGYYPKHLIFEYREKMADGEGLSRSGAVFDSSTTLSVGDGFQS